ncbi:MAG: adenosine deaminase [Betaproteobacteria bacterium]|nr:adenosine deaminase [Betaproteobacteria bacterium]
MPAHADEAWFDAVKAKATPQQLYTFLYALPKGGDLHNHLSGAGRSEWWWDAALAQQARGYTYYTKVRIENCEPYGVDAFGRTPYLLLFRNVQESNYNRLNACEKSEYKRLQDLTPQEKTGWLNSIRLDRAYEGRDEFFGAHWQRLNDLEANPYVISEILYRNMAAFSAEGVAYLELINSVTGFLKPDGSLFSPDDVADIYRNRLASADARATGVEVRFQTFVLRFLPNAEEQLKQQYAFVDKHRDMFVGINFVGREDNAKGYPLRFLPTLRELRKHYPDINLAIHAGEVDEPNFHVRDSLLLGAKRIGHGVNLITDPQTMLLMRNNHTMVEINLISNLLLNYVSDFSQHPFPEYLRFGIPVALSTDDRGMWDSNLTDEYFVAVTQFNLSWQEIVQMGRNSLTYSFLDQATRQRLLRQYDQRVTRFEDQFKQNGWNALKDVHPVSYSFLCKHYKLCLQEKPVSHN